MSGNILVLDIETVRDHAVWTPPEDAPDLFAPPFAWRPIVIGCVLLKEGPFGHISATRAGAIRSTAPGTDEGERGLLRDFADTIGKLHPTVVTWNGRRFDLPVLMLRSMRQGVQAPWYYGYRECRYRFSEDGHCDLADAMADYGATMSLGLDGMAKTIGCPGKFGDIAGADVEKAFAHGRYDDIANYCIADALQTAFLWLRWLLLKGDMNARAYQLAAGGLLKLAPAPFIERVDHRVLMLEDVPAEAQSDVA